MDDVTVVIPWRAGCPYRERALEWVRARYTAEGWPVTLASWDGEWSKGAALAVVADVPSEIVVIADADVWCDGLPQALEAVRNGASWAIPHRMLHRLDEDATSTLITIGTPGAGRARRPYTGHAGGGIVVIPKANYLRCPIDRRFVGWGQEDDSWALALTTLFGQPWRGNADLIHLWHPPSPRLTRRWGSQAGADLHERYRKAARSVSATERLIGEAR